MNESDYLDKLEGCICRELARRDHGDATPKRLRGWWCDGLVADTFVNGKRPHLLGRAWLVYGGGPRMQQEPWNFVLYLDSSVQSREAINWARLIPPDDMVGWLGVHRRRKLLEIDPLGRMPNSTRAH